MADRIVPKRSTTSLYASFIDESCYSPLLLRSRSNYPRRWSRQIHTAIAQSQSNRYDFLPADPVLQSASPPHPSTAQTFREPYWQKIGLWQDIEEKDFLSYQWQIKNKIDRNAKLIPFLRMNVPEILPQSNGLMDQLGHLKTKEDFIMDVEEGMKLAPMAVRLPPHILSRIDWNNPLEDPIRRQFIPLKSTMVPDHPALELDSLHETDDSPVEGLVHRYPEKVLFLATSVCPVYCRFCTRSYAVGSNTDLVTKASKTPSLRRWTAMFDYIEKTPGIQDVVVSGGDSYQLRSDELRLIGNRLLSMPNIKRFRFATRGLAVCPSRVLDPADDWIEAFIEISNKSRSMGKQVALHTHFNHPNEITWVTELAGRYLWEQGVVVRNQTVVLRGINDNVGTMGTLMRKLADINIMPYYVYQGDMIRGVEELRTPLSTTLHLAKQLQGTIAGFMTPRFVVDLPKGGGKRMVDSYESYDPKTGLSVWKAPGVAPGKTFYYHDPVRKELGDKSPAD